MPVQGTELIPYTGKTQALSYIKFSGILSACCSYPVCFVWQSEICPRAQDWPSAVLTEVGGTFATERQD